MIVLKAPQEKFLSALQAVAGIVERRHTLPILANVLDRKNGAQIEFTTSDLEIQVRTTAELGGDASTFATTVGASKLIDILRSMPNDQVVTLSATQNEADARTAARAASPCRPCLPTTFPWCRSRPTSGRCSACRKRSCAASSHQVHFAMAVHDIRYYLNGILFVAEGKSLTLVATDGHRLALAQATLEIGHPEAGSHPAAQDRARAAAPAARRRRARADRDALRSATRPSSRSRAWSS